MGVDADYVGLVLRRVVGYHVPDVVGASVVKMDKLAHYWLVLGQAAAVSHNVLSTLCGA